MIGDLTRDVVRVGLRRDEVLALLGPADWEETTGERYLRYNLGTCGDLFPLDEYFLYLNYDSHEVVEEVDVRE